jgi:hypothetical protein
MMMVTTEKLYIIWLSNLPVVQCLYALGHIENPFEKFKVTNSNDYYILRQTLSHNVVHLTLIETRTHNISGDRH